MVEILTAMWPKKISKYFNNGRSGLVSEEGFRPPFLVKNMKKMCKWIYWVKTTRGHIFLPPHVEEYMRAVI